MGEITLKIKYFSDSSERILEYIKNYNSLFGLVYNYKFENIKASTKEVMNYLKTKNNIFLDTYFRNGAIYDSKNEISKNKNKKIIFGGKKLFKERILNKISKENFKLKRLRSLNMVGAAHDHGNCKFQILSENEIIFKPCRNEHFILKLENVGKNYKKYLKSLIVCQLQNKIPISYKLSQEYIYIVFDISRIETIKKIYKKKDRLFAIDMNPNYIGWSVIDWKNSDNYNLIRSGVISIKDLNDFENTLKVSSNSKEKLKVSNKRNFETIQTAYELIKLSNHYHCQIFAIEDLNIKNKNLGKGRKNNKLCNNQWNRGKLVSVLSKLCDLHKIQWLPVMANYSSLEGNLIYRNEKLPDMCLASIEISRRGFEFYHQYILKDFKINKNIIFNNSKKAKEAIVQSLEELNYSGAWKELKDLFYFLKKRRCNYRFPIEMAVKAHSNSLFSKKFIKAYKTYYEFT